MSTQPYYEDESVTLYLGDCREVLPELGVTANCIIADPPYESTSLEWDRWPDGWLEVAAQVSSSMWCFLPLRQFAEPPYRGAEFRAAGWKLSQDDVWEKQNGSGCATDRFRRVHETMTHWYRGRWRDVHHAVPRLPNQSRDRGNKTPELKNADRFARAVEGGTQPAAVTLRGTGPDGSAPGCTGPGSTGKP